MHLNFDSRIEFVDHIINTCDVSKFLDIGGAGSSPNIPLEFRPLGKYILNEIIEQRGLYIAIDNSSENLRVLTSQQNQFNRNAKGYTWDKVRKKWYAKIMIDRKTVNLGRFTKEEDARAAYLEAKERLHLIPEN